MATSKLGDKTKSKDGNQPKNPKGGAFERPVPGSASAQPPKKPKTAGSTKKK